MTCAALQITGELRHASYVESWLKMLKGDPKAILTGRLSRFKSYGLSSLLYRGRSRARLVTEPRHERGFSYEIMGE
jgi:hypothetical protein